MRHDTLRTKPAASEPCQSWRANWHDGKGIAITTSPSAVAARKGMVTDCDHLHKDVSPCQCMALQRECGLNRQYAIKCRSDALVGTDVHIGCAVVVVAVVAAEEARAECLSVQETCLEQ